MTKKAQEIAGQIKNLVDRLTSMATGQSTSKEPSKPIKATGSKKGAAGGISVLMHEGFFDKPKDLSAVMERLKEIGRYYGKSTVAMNLLNLTKRRSLNRIKDSKTKNWQYVSRK